MYSKRGGLELWADPRIPAVDNLFKKALYRNDQQVYLHQVTLKPVNDGNYRISFDLVEPRITGPTLKEYPHQQPRQKVWKIPECLTKMR